MRWIGLIFITCLMSCRQNTTTGCEEGELWKLADFTVSTALNAYQVFPGSPPLFDRHFNGLTTENDLKFENIHPGPGFYDFTGADRLIRAAYERNIRIHGHPLVWHQQLPEWVGQSHDLREVMIDHIQTLVNRYRGQVHAWDVVNEALDERGGLRKTVWLENIGEDYLYLAYKTAQDADPGALLFYNDFNLASNPRKLDAAISICRNLRNRGIRISGIGMQMHISIAGPYRMELQEAVDKIWRAGFMVHFSELDVSVNPWVTKTTITEKDLREQQDTYYDVVRIYRSIPPQYQYGITLWGLTDADSWLPAYFNRVDAGLLFNTSGQPKPAYCGFQNALK